MVFQNNSLTYSRLSIGIPDAASKLKLGCLSSFLSKRGLGKVAYFRHYIFLLPIDSLMSKAVDTVNKDIRWKGENKPADLDFADDIALTADSIEDLQIITTNLEKAVAKVGLKINQDKTKVMVIQQKVSDRTSYEIKVEGKTIGTVNKFKYLGSVISTNGNVDGDINNENW